MAPPWEPHPSRNMAAEYRLRRICNCCREKGTGWRGSGHLSLTWPLERKRYGHFIATTIVTAISVVVILLKCAENDQKALIQKLKSFLRVLHRKPQIKPAAWRTFCLHKHDNNTGNTLCKYMKIISNEYEKYKALCIPMCLYRNIKKPCCCLPPGLLCLHHKTSSRWTLCLLTCVWETVTNFGYCWTGFKACFQSMVINHSFNNSQNLTWYTNCWEFYCGLLCNQ